MALLEERKKKLAAEGLFDEARKQLLPFLPEVIGVVTSPTGAVIRDILHRLADRFPRRVLVWPVRVQGEGSAAEVAAAIRGFNALPQAAACRGPTCIIVARGGGSLEDLWCVQRRPAMLQIKLPDGSIKEYPEGVRPREVAAGIGKRLAEAAVAAVADGTVVDLDRPLGERHDRPDRAADPDLAGSRGARRPPPFDRAHHGPGHHAAVPRGAGWRSGPTTASGFYYDVEIAGRSLSEDDFPAIEAEMAKILKDAEPFERFSLPVDEARQFVADLGQTLKVEHIDDELHKFGVLSFYRQGEFVDLCRGPHIPHAGKVGAFKLLSIAGAYWKGQTDRKMLQRVYGTAFFDKKDLDAYLAQVEEARKRDHRKLGKELGLFTISPLVGPGLILWMPKGAIVRGILENFMKTS